MDDRTDAPELELTTTPMAEGPDALQLSATDAPAADPGDAFAMHLADAAKPAAGEPVKSQKPSKPVTAEANASVVAALMGKPLAKSAKPAPPSPAARPSEAAGPTPPAAPQAAAPVQPDARAQAAARIEAALAGDPIVRTTSATVPAPADDTAAPADAAAARENDAAARAPVIAARAPAVPAPAPVIAARAPVIAAPAPIVPARADVAPAGADAAILLTSTPAGTDGPPAAGPQAVAVRPVLSASVADAASTGSIGGVSVDRLPVHDTMTDALALSPALAGPAAGDAVPMGAVFVPTAAAGGGAVDALVATVAPGRPVLAPAFPPAGLLPVAASADVVINSPPDTAPAVSLPRSVRPATPVLKADPAAPVRGASVAAVPMVATVDPEVPPAPVAPVAPKRRPKARPPEAASPFAFTPVIAGPAVDADPAAASAVAVEDDAPDAAVAPPGPTGAWWTIPLTFVGIAIVACAVLVPAADDTRRDAHELAKIEQDVTYFEKQAAVNADFLKRVNTDPTLAERLAMRQLHQTRAGVRVAPLAGTVADRFGASPFAMTRLDPPRPLPPYQPVPGKLGEWFVGDKRPQQMAALGLLVAGAGVLLGGVPRRRTVAE